MAEEVKGKWVTVRGAHVFIPDGETPDFSKGRRLQKTVKKENTKKGREDEEYSRLEDDISQTSRYAKTIPSITNIGKNISIRTGMTVAI